MCSFIQGESVHICASSQVLLIFTSLLFCLYREDASKLSREKEASDRVQNISAMKESLEKQMEQHREQHAKHLADLREEVAEKQTLIDQLKE